MWENSLFENTFPIPINHIQNTHLRIKSLNVLLTVSCLCRVCSHPQVFASQFRCSRLFICKSSQNKLALLLPAVSLKHQSLLFQLNYDSLPPKSCCQIVFSALSRSMSFWFPSQSDRITVLTLRGVKRNTVHLATRRQCGRLQTFTGTAQAKFS